MSTPISYVTMREEEGYKPASKFKVYKQDSSRPIAAILSLNTIANTIGAAGVGQQANILFGSHWFALVSVIVTILILVFSEIVPKSIGTSHWKDLLWLSRVMNFLVYLLHMPVLRHVVPRFVTLDTTTVPGYLLQLAFAFICSLSGAVLLRALIISPLQSLLRKLPGLRLSQQEKSHHG